jgi:hypothetical protein
LASKLTPHLIAHLKNCPSDLHKIPPQVFEHLIAEFYASWGFEDVRLVGTDPHTAADVFALSKKDPSGVSVRHFIEVKRWKDRVGVEVVNGVHGAFLRERIKHGWHLGMVVSLGGFKDFKSTSQMELKRLGIELRNGNQVLEWLKEYEPNHEGLWLPNPLRTMPKEDLDVE